MKLDFNFANLTQRMQFNHLMKPMIFSLTEILSFLKVILENWAVYVIVIDINFHYVYNRKFLGALQVGLKSIFYRWQKWWKKGHGCKLIYC